TALSAEFTIGEGELMAHDVPLGCAPDEYDDLISGTCSHLPKGKTHDVLTGSDDGRHSNTSLAWGAGVQFNPTESVAIDIAYEGPGSGDWRTDGFIVGVGYKF
ncbi:Ail/Lom family outer membrane beta-barrel protein, partial [Escherichia coli]